MSPLRCGSHLFQWGSTFYYVRKEASDLFVKSVVACRPSTATTNSVGILIRASFSQEIYSLVNLKCSFQIWTAGLVLQVILDTSTLLYLKL